MKYFITILLLLSISACNDQFHEQRILSYEPLKFNGDTFVINQELMNKQHFDQVENVLSFYEVSYTRSSALKIRLHNPISKEMGFNYTSKAKDSGWLKARGF